VAGDANCEVLSWLSIASTTYAYAVPETSPVSVYDGEVTVATSPADGASSYTRYPVSLLVPAAEAPHDKVAPVALTELTDGVPGADGGSAEDAVSDVSGEVMNCAMFDAGDA
jgi:hypothetical protein